MKPGVLWRLSLVELDALHVEAKARDAANLLTALGSPAAVVEFHRLDRKRGSLDTQRADQGSAEFDERFGDLTAEQERLIYGVGETDAQADEVKTLIDAHLSFHISDPLPQIARIASFASMHLSAEALNAVTSDQGSIEAQAAVVQLTRAVHALKERGLEGADVVDGLARAMVELGCTREMGDSFDAFEPRMAGVVPARKQH